ncbi:MAG TPA: hypothetical protein VEF07_08530, partial [Candidatus Binataceae bacterium]|nr:hypothetical protein [Candidatus Binataceae bacterium]
VWFALPLEWYTIRNGRPVFEDWALLCPFVFVDNTLSVAGAREVQGWSKRSGVFDAPGEPRIYSPPQPAQSLKLSIRTAPDEYRGRELRTLLEIYREPSGYVSFPPALGDLNDLILGAPRAAARSMAAVADAAGALAGLPICGYERLRDLGSLLRMGGRGLGYVSSLLPKLLWRQPPLPTEPEEPRARTFWLNLVNLKQFRDAEDADAACYQAIVNSRMDVDRYNGGGLLFNPLWGDPSGGFYLRIYQEESQPIIEALGLEVAEESTIAGKRAATLRPLLALWLDGDVSYGTGEALCWRTRNSSWHTGAGRGEPTKDSNEYNTTQGAALAEMPGPFFFPNSTIRVLPLMADAERLRRFCADYLDHDDYRFEPWGSYVYMTASSHENVSAERESLGTLTLREVSFLVPVKWYDRAGMLLSVALVSPFGYMDDETAVITAHEVYGLEVAQAAIESPANAWMGDAGPIETRQPLLRLTTAVLPALYLGRKAEERRLVEVQEADALASSEDPAWRFIAGDWAPRLLADHRGKIAAREKSPEDFEAAAALAIDLLANRGCIDTIALKQFRDCEEPNRACYQALVLNRRSIEQVYELREIEPLIHVRIDRYPTQPIVERLGLAVKWTDSSSGPTLIDIVQPVRPFWIKAAMKQGSSTNLSWRAGTKQWNTRTPAPAGGRTLNAIDTIDPHMVIEAILSRRGRDGAGSERGRRGADFRIRVDSVAKPFGDYVFAAGKRSDDGEWYSEDGGEHPGKDEEAAKRRR